jgi:hypothetical protein
MSPYPLSREALRLRTPHTIPRARRAPAWSPRVHHGRWFALGHRLANEGDLTNPIGAQARGEAHTTPGPHSFPIANGVSLPIAITVGTRPRLPVVNGWL